MFWTRHAKAGLAKKFGQSPEVIPILERAYEANEYELMLSSGNEIKIWMPTFSIGLVIDKTRDLIITTFYTKVLKTLKKEKLSVLTWTEHAKKRLSERFHIDRYEYAIPIIDKIYENMDYIVTRGPDTSGISKIWIKHLQLVLGINMKEKCVVTVINKEKKWNPKIEEKRES